MCIRDRVSPDEVKQYEEDDQWILDTGSEWEVWDIVTLKNMMR